jgi:hypothetical protein
MAQKQIFRDGNRLGFLPWGTGRRLGAARWTDLGKDVLGELSAQIQIANTIEHQIPDIPALFRNDTIYELPESTIGAHFTPSQPITWSIDSMDGDSFLSAGFQLNVRGAEASRFKLIANVEGAIINRYECQIEEKENVQLDSFTVRVKPDLHNQEVGMCELLCNTEQRFSQYYQDDLQKVELRIGKGIHSPKTNKLDVKNKMMSFGSSFILHLSKCLHEESDLAEIKWFTGQQVFTAEVTLDYTEMNLQAIDSTGHFNPDIIQFTELYTDNPPDEKLTTFNLLIGRHILHDWPVSLEIKTPTAIFLDEITAPSMSIQVKREKLLDWFDSPSEVDPDFSYRRTITLTPYIAGKALRHLSSSAQIQLEIPTRPSLGFQGEKNVGWKKFLLRPQGEYHTIQNQHNIVNLFAGEDWIEEIPSEKLFSMNRNNIYRTICKTLALPPETNCEKTDELLNQSFIYHEDRIDVVFKSGKILGDLYGGKKGIDIDSTEVQILYPRQKFQLEYNGEGVEIHTGDAKSLSRQLNPLAVLTSMGTKYYSRDMAFDYDRMPEAFAYKTNNNTFTAPQTPGVYYLHVPSKGEHYLVELEVHGFIQGAIE